MKFKKKYPKILVAFSPPPKLFFLCSLIALLVVDNSYAQDKNGSWLPESVQIHGFLSQGFVNTSDNNFSGRSDDNISIDFRELGINGSWQATPDLQVAMQITWRDQGELDEDRLRIDYALIDYNLFSTENFLLGIKAGRVPNSYGLYNDTRDIASTRPTIFLPQSIYFDRTRNLTLSADGGVFYSEYRSPIGDFYLNIGALHGRTDDAHLKNLVIGNLSGSISGDFTLLSRLLYEFKEGVVRLAITYADTHLNYESRNNLLSSGGMTFNPIVFSAQYNSEDWSLTGEYALRRSKWDDFGILPNSVFTGESFYLQGSYRFTSYLEGLVRYDSLVTDKDDRNGNKAKNKYGVANYSRFAKDWTIGLRLKPYTELLVSAEYHRINGTAWISQLENKSTTTQYWDLYALMISYNF